MRSTSLVVAVLLGAQAVPCAGQERAHDSAFYLSPLVNAVRTDDDRSIGDDSAFTLATGFEARPNWNVELNLFRGRFDGVGGDDHQIDSAGVNALRVFRRDARVAPYALVGVGSQDKDRASGGGSSDAYGDAGGGLLVRLRDSTATGDKLSLRLDLRARHDDTDEGSRIDRMFGIGLQFTFGAASSAPSPAVPAAALPPAAPPADGDGDGVPDGRDRCPGTGSGTAVDGSGCALDGDRDGVENTADACPSTPPGTRIDARGCELQPEIRLPLVLFEHDSDRLLSEALATLDEAVETLRRNADLRVEVAGHTDSSGSDAYNLGLSQRRAEAVRRYLLERGVRNTMAPRGYGETEPVADNETAEGRTRNRRVVLRLLPP